MGHTCIVSIEREMIQTILMTATNKISLARLIPKLAPQDFKLREGGLREMRGWVMRDERRYFEQWQEVER